MASSLFMGCAIKGGAIKGCSAKGCGTKGCCVNKAVNNTEPSEPKEPIEPTEGAEGVMPEVPDVKMPEMPSITKPTVYHMGISEKELFLYHYDKHKLEEKGIRAIWLQYFLKEWSQTHNAEFSRKYGFKWRDENSDPNEFGTYSRFTGLDSDLNQLHQMLKWIKFGFGSCLDQACYDLRDKRITRNDAINLVLKYDGKCSEKYVKKFCDFIDISMDEFWSHSNKFRGEMWHKNQENEWENEFRGLLKQEIK